MENKLITELCDRIYSNHTFQEDFEKLLKVELRTVDSTDGISETQLKKLLESAAIMSLSQDTTYQKLAFKVAIFLLNQFKNKYPTLPFSTELILTRLGDLPTIRHMFEQKHGHDYFSYFHDTEKGFSFFQLIEVLAKKILNQYEISSSLTLNLTNFQAEIFRNLIANKNVSFSAPTSAGKSYIIHNFIAYQMWKQSKFSVIYLVPTKSLITEVKSSIIEKLKEFPLDHKEVAVVGSADQLNTELYKDIEKRILVLTQERMQYIISHGLDFQVDLLIVDEAQKVKESERGVILEEVVEDTIKRNPKSQIVFISPFIKNPSKFMELFDIPEVKSFSTSKTPVGQNIFYVTLKKREVIISVLSEELDRKTIEIEKIPLPAPLPKSQFRVKSWVVNNILGKKGNSLIYCNRPSECVKISDEVSKERGQLELSAELKEAIDFLKSHVHEQYYLPTHLRSGIGYHYGRMPHFVRRVVKELFDKKQIDYLCCTSTLLEGVNLPAKNILLHKPKAGQRNPMDKFSIKNLAGRAGRLGKDYYGNIYCVDIESWEDGLETFDDELETIESSSEKTLSTNLDLVIEHLEKYKIPEYGTRNVAAVATSLIVRQLKYPDQNLFEVLRKKFPDLSIDKIRKISSQVNNILNEISELDREIILKNSTIDPRLQFELFSHLKKPQNLILPPEPWFENFYKDLEGIFELIQSHFFKDDFKKTNYRYYTFVANQWINQESYKQILEHRIRYLEEKTGQPLTKSEINSSIDRVDEILESILKYYYARGMRCYCDIAESIIEKRGIIEEYSKELPEYLETGAHDKKVFLLLSVGLSRNNAIKISRKMDDDVDSNLKCMEWLRKNQEKIKNDLHPLMYLELDELLKSQ